MCYYNIDENTTPAPGTDHKLSTDTFEEWRKGFEQVDDILVMGIRL